MGDRFSPSNGVPAPEDAGRKVCDQCRTRKIRCDKEWPCSPCRTAGRSCSSTGAGQRPRETRQRVLISSQYEKKIDRIENRLGSIESLLKNLTIGSASSSLPAYSHGTTPDFNTLPVPATDLDNSSDDESAYGGDSGLTAETAFASEFLQRVVKKTPHTQVNPKMDAALANLVQLVEIQKHRSISHGPRFPLQVPLPQGGITKLPMPPAALVVSLLKQMKTSPPTVFSVLCPLIGITDFAALCRSVYFATEDFSEATFLNVNAGLYNLFMEQQSLTDDATIRTEYGTYQLMCQVNIETGLANLPLFWSPKIENAQALVMGAMYAIDTSRPSVAWILTSAAAQLCQTGGFHRLPHSTEPSDITQFKQAIFWQVYMLDKGLSLRLGRTSVIRESDIEISRTGVDTGVSLLNDSGLADLWISISALQGEIYEQLYSPAALRQPQAEITRRARIIGDELTRQMTDADGRRESVIAALKNLGSSISMEIFLRGDSLQCAVIKTLAYRAVPAPEGSISRFCTECLESARKAMVLHQQSVELMDSVASVRSIYFHWNLLLTPYAPFFVLFCYVIETSSAADLELLHSFVVSLETSREDSATVENLWRLCKVMYDVVSLYVEAKSQQQQDQTMGSIGDEFELYLSQLGVLPANQAAVANGGPNVGASMSSITMDDWLVGSHNMLGLLEEDLSQMGGYQWTEQPNHRNHPGS